VTVSLVEMHQTRSTMKCTSVPPCGATVAWKRLYIYTVLYAYSISSESTIEYHYQMHTYTDM